MVIDGDPCHVHTQVPLVFLPPPETPKLHPCKRGVVENLKMNFIKYLLQVPCRLSSTSMLAEGLLLHQQHCRSVAWQHCRRVVWQYLDFRTRDDSVSPALPCE